MEDTIKRNAALAAAACNPKPDRRRTRGDRPLVYLTTTYNLYDPQMTAICESFANRYTRNKGLGAADRDIFVDECRDELARIMESYDLARNNNPYAYARIRLSLRVNDVWAKFRTRQKRFGRMVSLDAPSAPDSQRTVEESGEFLRALEELAEEQAVDNLRRRRLERLDAILASMPWELKEAAQALVAAGGSKRGAARLFGVSHQAFDETWIRKLREYLLANGIMDDKEDGDEQ